MNRRKRKIKRLTKLWIFIFIFILIVFSSIKIVNTINYHKTYEYKLLKLGYKTEEVKVLDKLTDETKDYILTLKYNTDITPLAKEKYFIEKNLKDYLDYIKDNEKNYTDVIAIVNVGANVPWYSKNNPTIVDKGPLMLTNKFNFLDKFYNSENMKKLSNRYSYGEDQMLLEEAYNAFIEMFNAAKEEDLTLIVNSSYRGYYEQKEVYDYYKAVLGEEAADKRAARPGFSEHQTGLCVDIQTYGSSAATFEEFDEFKWLQKHAHEYGFILRYPKGKEYLTGYEYESWHYRYVGLEVAKYIHENNITFDEYYAYFLN